MDLSSASELQSSPSCSSSASSPCSTYQPDINSDRDMCFGDLLSLCSGDRINLINYLQTIGLLPHKYICPECDSNMKLIRTSKSDGYWWECKSQRSDSAHKVRRSLRKETWFAKSKLTIVEIVILMYYWIEETPKKIVQKEMKLDSKTVVDWFSFCREICGITLEKRTNKLGGEGHIVEISTSLFGKRKVREEKVEKELQLVGFIDHFTNDCFLVAVENCNAESLVTIIEGRIFPGTVLCSDSWKTYNCFSNPDFQLLQVNNSLIIENKDACLINSIESLWLKAKQNLLSRLRKEELMQSYLFEFVYRRSTGKQNRFQKFLQDIAAVYPPSVSG